MGDKISLKIAAREVHGKKVSKLRGQGLTPGVVYGHDMEATPIQVETGELLKVVAKAGTYTPVHLIGNKRRIAMIKDVDRDPVKAAIRHISFHAVKANEPVEAKVPIRLVGEGESAAEKSGLIILQALDEIEVKALPMDLPDGLEADITNLAEAGDRVTLGDIKLPEGVEFVEKASAEAEHEDGDVEEDNPQLTDLVVASAYEPSALQAANEAAAGDAEDASADNVEAENGEDTDQGSQDEETRPGGKGQDEPKQENVDANK